MSAPSPFEIITPNNKRTDSKGIIIALVVILFLIASVVMGIVLVRQNQNVSEKAVDNLHTASPVPTRSPSPKPTNSPSPSPSPSSSGQALCSATCSSSSQCGSGRICYITTGTTGMCRNSACVNQEDCLCLETESPTPTPLEEDEDFDDGIQTTPLPIPETGTSLPTILGGIFGVLVIVGSLILAF